MRRLGFDARRALGQLPHVRQELRIAGDVLPQNLGHLDSVFSLVVLKDAAEAALGGGEGGVLGVVSAQEKRLGWAFGTYEGVGVDFAR